MSVHVSAEPGSRAEPASPASPGSPAPEWPGQEADDPEAVIRALFDAHYQPLVRLASTFVRDVATSEEIAQDAFVALHRAWPRLRDTGRALSYLRRSVTNGSVSVIRRRATAARYVPDSVPDAPSAEQVITTLLDRQAVVAALGRLPARQREVLVLRYFADLSEADAAQTMGISRGTLKSHTWRAMSALRKHLEQAA
jgi:RNA polymerase sigma-70 factor (sigma-E family)